MNKITYFDLLAMLRARYPKTYRKLVARLKAREVKYEI